MTSLGEPVIFVSARAEMQKPGMSADETEATFITLRMTPTVNFYQPIRRPHFRPHLEHLSRASPGTVLGRSGGGDSLSSRLEKRKDGFRHL